MRHVLSVYCTKFTWGWVLEREYPISGCHAEVAGVCLMKVGLRMLLMSRSTVLYFQTLTRTFRKIPCLNRKPKLC